MANILIHPHFIEAYVYALIVDDVVRYIGKGRRYRAVEHLTIARELLRRRAAGEKVRARYIHNKLAKEIRSGSVIGYKVICNGLTDAEAYKREVAEIASYPPGQLWNKHRGGDGGDADMMRSFWRDPTYRSWISNRIRQGHLDPEYRERARATTQAYWNDPGYYARQMTREKALWADPVYRAKRIAILRKVWADPEKSARKSALVKTQWTPERKAAMAENRRRAWADPEFKRRATESIRRAKLRAKPDGRSEQGGVLHSAGVEEVQT